MAKAGVNTILARHSPAGFIGRALQVEQLLDLARRPTGGICVLAAPGAGLSELFRHTYDRLFTEQKEVIPFYFELSRYDGTAAAAAARFLSEFVLHTTAFRQRNPKLLAAPPTTEELLDPDSVGGIWIERLLHSCTRTSSNGMEPALAKNCLAAPVRAAAEGTRVVVMIDAIEEAAEIEGGEKLIRDLISIFSGSKVPFAFGGLRRFLYRRTPFKTMPLEGFSFSEAGRLIEDLAAHERVAINHQTRDLIAVQLGGDVHHIGSILSSAAASGDSLDSFAKVEQVYTDSVFGGRIGKRLDETFGRGDVPQNAIRLMAETLLSEDRRLPMSYWQKNLGAVGDRFKRYLHKLHTNEFINLGSGQVHVESDDQTVLADYIDNRVRLDLNGQQRALAVGEAMAENIKRAPTLMARQYRRMSALDLRTVMGAFDGREVPLALLDYGSFRDKYKGRVQSKIIGEINNESAKITLPQIVYTAHTSAFYPKLRDICDTERSAVAFGFTELATKDEIVWIAAEIDSKLEATAETAEFWCDRLEMVALNCNFPRIQLWLIAPEGFDDLALEVLTDRNALGSSRAQAEMLISDLRPGPLAAKPPVDEYEFVVPMGPDTEMIAAQVVEEIAKRANFGSKAINQIKTALVEACINAAEHSLSPDRRIYQTFRVDNEKLIITVSNRGVRLTDMTTESKSTLRRGWGLKLIKGLMDDVQIGQTDDGTRLTMVKYVSPPG